jgi:lipopolysaccharide transport system permease protein
MNPHQKITIYSANPSNRSVFFHLGEVIRDLQQAHELGYRLFKRNLKVLYRQSLLGFGWVLFPPIATAALWIFLRNNVMTMSDTGIPYPVFVLTGTILWQIFHEAILSPLNQVTANKAILSKINISREGLLLSGIYEMIFNICIKIGLLSVIYLYFNQSASLSSLVLVPIGIFSISLTGFAIGLALTPLGMLYQDINKGLTVILPFLMYMTPVVYPKPSTEGTIGMIMMMNPMATLIPTTRNWFTAQPVYDMQLFWIFTMGFGLLFLFSLIVYRLAMPMIIERIGS